MSQKKLIPLILLCSGIILMLQIALPIATYKLWEVVNIDNNSNFTSPYPQNDSPVLGISVKNSSDFSAIVSTAKRSSAAPYQQFTISVPRLSLVDAKVIVDSNDADKGLVHLPGAPLPGEKGNVFISGHSSVLFHDNFSKLAQLQKGDQIAVKIGQTQIQYSVIGSKVVDPKDLSVINPPESEGRYLTLMTCVPPGLSIRRLVVLATLI